jgi:predicted  nucleic acid-binding Zn-ribbon protein
MPNLESKQSILVIAGMHRSGTSYVASLLQDAGFDIGENLLGATVSNLKGHFEDIDFLRFHESVLHSQGLSPEGWIIQNNIQVQEQFLEDAQTIIQKRNSKSFWGWKDPRTTLLLDFWFNLLPEAKYLFVYRSPSEVIDSLYRRGDEIFFKNPMFALQIWLNYNQAVLNFYEKHPEKCIILSVYDTIAHPENLIELLNNQFNLKLHLSQNLFDDSLFHRQALDLHRPSLLKQYFPEAIDIYQQLHETAKLFGDSTDVSLLKGIQTDCNYKTWLFQDWQDACRFKRERKNIEQQLHQTQVALEQSNQQLHQTQVELEQSNQQLHQTQVELEQSNQQLHQTQVELEQSNQQLHQTQVELEQSNQQLHQTQVELEQSNQQLHQTQVELEQSNQQLHQTQVELEQSNQQLHQTQVELEQSNQQLHQTQVELEQSNQQLHQTQVELEQSNQQLHQTQVELEQSNQQLHQTQVELEQSNQQLHQTQVELEQSNQQLHQTQVELEQSQIEWKKTQLQLEDSHQKWEDLQLKFKDLSKICENFQNLQTIQNIKIEEQEEKIEALKNDLHHSFQQEKIFKEMIIAMESSKFWKIREKWFLVKKLIGLKVEAHSTTVNDKL